MAERKKLAANLALSAVSLLVTAPIAGELFFRLGIALDAEALKNPRLYAGWTDDDDCWKLRYRWRDPARDVWDGPLVFDPDLGWTMGEQAEGRCGDCERPVLLYGDSFLFGVAPVPEKRRIAGQLRRFLKGRAVVNYAVNGYGLDQIFLRLRATHPDYEKPILVAGIMTLDLDRSIFSVRDGPKPYFRLTDGELELRGVPVEADTEAWHREHPPSLYSYFFSFLTRRYRLSKAPLETEIPYKRAEKAEINAEILEALAREAADHDLALLAVVFYPPWELGTRGWREPFLKGHLERLGIPYVDTKALFLGETDEAAKDLYLPEPNNHPNAAGNRVVAKEIARRLRSMGRRY